MFAYSECLQTGSKNVVYSKSETAETGYKLILSNQGQQKGRLKDVPFVGMYLGDVTRSRSSRKLCFGSTSVQDDKWR